MRADEGELDTVGQANVLRGLSISLCAVSAVWILPKIAKSSRAALVSSVAGTQEAMDKARLARVLVAEAFADWGAEVSYRRGQSVLVGGNGPTSLLTKSSSDRYAGDNQLVDAQAVNK